MLQDKHLKWLDKQDSEIDLRLKTELKTLWNNDDFIFGVFVDLKEQEDRNIMLQFIDKARRLKDNITSDDMAALSFVLAKKREQKKEKDNGKR